MTVTVTYFHTNSCNRRCKVTYENQLQADLQTGYRGGNKERLVARCWLALGNTSSDEDYMAFRKLWSKRSFLVIHKRFDHLLPERMRYKGYRDDSQPAYIAEPKDDKPMSKKAQKLAKSFERTPDLSHSQRQWVIEHGGVEQLDKCRYRLARNGKTFPFLDNSWFLTAQHIDKIAAGSASLV